MPYLGRSCINSAGASLSGMSSDHMVCRRKRQLLSCKVVHEGYHTPSQLQRSSCSQSNISERPRNHDFRSLEGFGAEPTTRNPSHFFRAAPTPNDAQTSTNADEMATDME